jgi:hypothetical protein
MISCEDMEYVFFDPIVPSSNLSLRLFADDYEEIIIPPCKRMVSSDNI